MDLCGCWLVASTTSGRAWKRSLRQFRAGCARRQTRELPAGTRSINHQLVTGQELKQAAEDKSVADHTDKGCAAAGVRCGLDVQVRVPFCWVRPAATGEPRAVTSACAQERDPRSRGRGH
jgi:hypothetical protein